MSQGELLVPIGGAPRLWRPGFDRASSCRRVANNLGVVAELRQRR